MYFQSLYCRFDKEEMTREEEFKCQQCDKFVGSSYIIRHHNPAYEGIVNSAFVQHDPEQHPAAASSSSIFHVSDAETEKSVGEVFIPLTTFRSAAAAAEVNQTCQQILDASSHVNSSAPLTLSNWFPSHLSVETQLQMKS